MHMIRYFENSFRQAAERLRALRDDVSGVSMVEFALALPIVTTLSLGGMELVNRTIANLRVSQIAMSVADNASRVRTSIDETDIDQIMIGARTSGDTLEFGQHARVILSSLEPNGLTGGNAGQMIRWQRCFGNKSVTSSWGLEGDGATNNSMVLGMGPAGKKITSAVGTAVMFVEVQYDYQPAVRIPMITKIFGPNPVLKYRAAFNVRERTNQTMTNINNMSVGLQRRCTRYSAT
jgi:hypothetical protein